MNFEKEQNIQEEGTIKRVRLLIARVTDFVGHEDDILKQIAPSYARKYHEHKVKEEACQELVSGYLLKRFLNVAVDDQIRIDEFGKPGLTDMTSYFNLTHSGEYAALAISDCTVGIDLEKTLDYHEVTAAKVFTKEQQAVLKRLGDHCDGAAEQNRTYTRFWTQLEAKLKLYGVGFSGGWESIRDADPCETVIQQIFWKEYILSCATKEKVELCTERVFYV
ncbi:MAG: 4'-phosphopantetheinyl transferase superfamily protein [Blautia sp.]|nr:4'-phosphopantetheinyl transferase superfamily protein [Blautia sp.]